MSSFPRNLNEGNLRIDFECPGCHNRTTKGYHQSRRAEYEHDLELYNAGKLLCYTCSVSQSDPTITPAPANLTAAQQWLADKLTAREGSTTWFELPDRAEPIIRALLAELATHRSGVQDYDALMAENAALKQEVERLTAMLKTIAENDTFAAEWIIPALQPKDNAAEQAERRIALVRVIQAVDVYHTPLADNDLLSEVAADLIERGWIVVVPNSIMPDIQYYYPTDEGRKMAGDT